MGFATYKVGELGSCLGLASQIHDLVRRGGHTVDFALLGSMSSLFCVVFMVLVGTRGGFAGAASFEKLKDLLGCPLFLGCWGTLGGNGSAST